MTAMRGADGHCSSSPYPINIEYIPTCYCYCCALTSMCCSAAIYTTRYRTKYQYMIPYQVVPCTLYGTVPTTNYTARSSASVPYQLLATDSRLNPLYQGTLLVMVAGNYRGGGHWAPPCSTVLGARAQQ